MNFMYKLLGFKKETILEADDGTICLSNQNELITDFDTDKEVWIKLIGKSQRTKKRRI